MAYITPFSWGVAFVEEETNFRDLHTPLEFEVGVVHFNSWMKKLRRKLWKRRRKLRSKLWKRRKRTVKRKGMEQRGGKLNRTAF